MVVCKDGTQKVSKELLLAFYPLFASCPSFAKCEAIAEPMIPRPMTPTDSRLDKETVVMVYPVVDR